MLKPIQIYKREKLNDEYKISDIYVVLDNVPQKYINKMKKIDSNFSKNNFMCKCEEYKFLKALKIDSLGVSKLLYKLNDEYIKLDYDVCKTNSKECGCIKSFVFSFLRETGEY